ncbi:MAG: hypothetical protein ACFWUA_03600 [Sporanaerobacter sp.]
MTNRYMTVFFVTLPIIGLLERYGLKQRAAELIGNVKAATAGKILSIYMVIRTISAALSLRLRYTTHSYGSKFQYSTCSNT